MPELVKVSINKILPNKDNILDKERKDVSELIKSMQSVGYDPSYPAKAIKVGNKYQLITGNRRYLASKKVTGYMYLILEKIEKEEQKYLEMIKENILRKNYNPLQEAKIFNNLKEKYNYSNQKVADMVCISEGYVRNRLKLLNLPKKVQNQVIEGKIVPRSAEYLSEIESEEVKERLAQEIINKGLYHDEVKKRVNLLKKIKEPQQLKLLEKKFKETESYQALKKERKERKSELQLQSESFETQLYEINSFAEQLTQLYGAFLTNFEKSDIRELYKINKNKKDLKNYMKSLIKNLNKLNNFLRHNVSKSLKKL